MSKRFSQVITHLQSALSVDRLDTCRGLAQIILKDFMHKVETHNTKHVFVH